MKKIFPQDDDEKWRKYANLGFGLK